MTPIPPTATCPGCGAVVEIEHVTCVTWSGEPVRYDAVQTETDALAEHMELCPRTDVP